MTKQQVDVITSVQRRRRWSRAEKERIVAAALAPGRLLPRWRVKRASTRASYSAGDKSFANERRCLPHSTR